MVRSSKTERPIEASTADVVRRRDPILERFASRVTAWVGGNLAFAIACATVLVWIATGPLFGFSDTWQLVINTGTTVVTFLMVFLIQRAQNKESRAVQLKLNELIAAMEGASNHLIGAEMLSESELRTLSQHYAALVAKIKDERDITQSHSIEEAEHRHAAKHHRSAQRSPHNAD